MRRSVFSFLVAIATVISNSHAAFAKLKVVTTTTDLAALVVEIGGEHVSVDSLARGTQDPHALESKPSYMIKVAKADLVIAIGMELELAWLPTILRGARNPSVMPGKDGYLEVGPMVEAIDIPEGEVSRAQGDVHPEGNPHVLLDPLRAAQIGGAIADRLALLDPGNVEKYRTRAGNFRRRMEEKTKAWRSRIDASGVKKVITFHKTLNYFLNRFGIALPAVLEPKPGIPPSSGHIIEVNRIIREEKVSLLLVENFYDPSVARKLVAMNPSLKVSVIPVAVGGARGIDSLDSLYERLVAEIEKGLEKRK